MTEQLSHGFFILAAYGVTAVVVGGLFAWLLVTGRARRARIESLNMRADVQEAGSRNG